MNWTQFREAAPGIAAEAERLFEKPDVLLIGTIRKDGSPRISPCEFLFVGDDLYLGMMWQSKKALDLLRDPRCTIHSAVADKNASDGEFKAHGRARAVTDVGELAAYGEVLFAKMGWRPGPDEFHLFAIEIDSAAYFVTATDHRKVTIWRAGGPERHFRQGMDSKLVPVE